jgi:1,4-dihydroxy-2-naphthoyl-CoA hydrolase
MTIWKKLPDLSAFNQTHLDTSVQHLGIEFTDVGDNWLEARMPVDARTMQASRTLHGGASVLLAETVGSAASNLCLDNDVQYAVGLDIDANHLRPVREGYVHARADPVHLGDLTQLWTITIRDDDGNLACISRLTMSIQGRK